MSVIGLCKANRDVQNEAPDKRQDCTDVVHLAFFFDGTGNNRDADDKEHKWSNVARLYDSARDESKNSIYRTYISGVGTRFNGKMGWAKSAWTWMEDGKLGNGFGAGGDIRLDEGEDQLNFALEKALLTNARQANDEVKKIAKANEDKGFQKLNEVLGKHRLIKFINISVFGFSRGAALARAFTSHLLDKCKPDGKNGLTLEGYPVRLVFLGVFDTVASFGLPGKNLTYPWGKRDLIVSKVVENCVHFVAGHELRDSFPVDLIRMKGQYACHHIEKVYPGVHSDVGGGYEVDKQARSDNLARIPLCDMHAVAWDGGTRLFTLGELKKDYFPYFQRFEVKKSTKDAYDYYRKLLGPACGSIESQVRTHMSLYYSYKGSIERKRRRSESRSNNASRIAAAQTEMAAAKKQLDPWLHKSPANKQEVDTFVAANAKYQEKQKKYNQVFSEGERLDIAESDLAKEAAAMELALKNGKNMKMRYGAFFKSYPAHAWMVSAWKTEASQELCDFFDHYVHDSRTDFLSGIEPSSYFSKRGIEESSEAVWQQASRWVGDKAHQAENAVEGAYDATKKKTVETYDATKKKTVETYDAAKKTASDAYDAAEKKTVDTYQVAKKKTGELIDAGEHKISEAYDATKHMANDAANSVAHTSDEIYQAGKQGISKGTHAVENAASDAANTLSEGWKNLTSLTK